MLPDAIAPSNLAKVLNRLLHGAGRLVARTHAHCHEGVPATERTEGQMVASCGFRIVVRVVPFGERIFGEQFQMQFEHSNGLDGILSQESSHGRLTHWHPRADKRVE